MSKNKSSNLKLSASAKKISELIESVSAGNQRGFARLVGCSQPVISRIVNGKQEPGRELLERISHLKGVDRESVLATLESEAALNRITETMIPIAHCLLDGPPAMRRELLTTNTVTVSPAVHRQSLYAVRASACEPAFGDVSEQMRSNDLIIIESSLGWLSKNLQTLNGKLCVIVIRGGDRNMITLRRVWVTYHVKEGKWGVRTCPDSNVEKYRQEKFGGRQLRVIQLDLPESQPEAESELVDQVVDVDDIVGFAIELIRSL